jgi:hypothetical protein
MAAASLTCVAHDMHVIVTDTPQFTAPLLGEPLNVILSGRSDPLMLTEDGFREYTK